MHFANLQKILDAWIPIDEGSQMPLATLGEISKCGLVGCKFIIIIENRVGQFLPIYHTWDVDRKHLPESTLMKVMCRGLRIKFDIYKRGQDRAPFNFYHGLYSTAVDDASLVQTNVKASCQNFPSARMTSSIISYSLIANI